LAKWFQEKFGHGSSRMRRIGIVALARRLAVDLWRFVQQGIVPAGARLRAQKA
jgi:transposase